MPKYGRHIARILAIIASVNLSFLSFVAFSASNLVDYFDHFSFEQGLSQGSPNCMVRDLQGYLWVGTQGGLNKFNGITFQTYLADGSNNNPSGNWITGCGIDGKGQLWFSTKSAGINKFSPSTNSFNVYSQHNTPLISDDRFNSLMVDNQQNVWIGSANGILYRIDSATSYFVRIEGDAQQVGKINHIALGGDNKIWLATSKGLFYVNDDKIYPMAAILKDDNPINSEVWSLTTDHQGQLWVGAKTGLFKLSFTSAKYRLEKIPLDLGWVTAIMERSPGELWINTYGKGLIVFDAVTKQTHRFTTDNNNVHSIKNNYLLSFFKDNEQSFWLGTDGKGLHRYLMSRNVFNHTTHKPNEKLTINNAFVRAITKDNQGNLWVGTRGGLNKQADTAEGFVQYLYDKSDLNSLPNNNVFALHTAADDSVWVGTYGGGLAKYEASTNSFRRFDESTGLPSNYVYAITSSDDGSLWLGTNKGLVQFNVKKEEFTHFYHQENSPESLSQNTVVSLLDDGKDTLWVATFLGLNRFDKITRTFSHIQKGENGLSDNMVTALHRDNFDNLWVGTMKGLNRIETDGTITQFDVEHGLPNSNIFGIYHGQDNQLWISTNNGLASFDYSDQSFKHFGIKEGVQDRSFILGAHFRDSDGTLYFGGVNGFNFFNPAHLQWNKNAPEVVLEQLYLFNNEVEIDNLNQRAEQNNAVLLTHKDSVFTVRFSAPQAVQQEKVEYAYRLIGFNEHWLTTSANSRAATFTNIPAGTYQLQVKARYSGADWGENKVLALKIATPPWLSLWAVSGYVLLAFGMLTTFYQLHRKKRSAEHEKHLAQAVLLAKDELLANVSHEFKTPLTLILGPVNELLQTAEDKSSIQLKTIKRNAEKLNVLVDNILNEQVVSARDISTTTDVGQLSRKIVEEMLPLANENKQCLLCDFIEPDTVYVDITPEKFELIIANLVSNAIKYAGKGKEIQLNVKEKEGECVFTIRDNGVGIALEQQNKIFSRRYRASNSDIAGHGLGLAIAKEIAEQAGGRIELNSELGQGAEFIVCLPLSIPPQLREITDLTLFDEQKLDKKLLIIDDNAEIRDYLVQCLSSHYECQVSINGHDGLALAKSWQPDIIVSDVMMPKMNGLAFLKALRHDQEISHIPVLMLSAYPTKSLKLQTLSLLADAFLAKPFDKSELHAALTNILAIRAMVQQQTLQAIQQGQVTALIESNDIEQDKAALCVKDQKFIEQLNVLLKQHYSEVDFTLSALAKKMFMSERNLQIKTKALLGLSPIDLIRDMRLQHAALMLEKSEVSVGEIAQLNGFNSQSYFSKCFKDKYDVTPNHYRKQQTNTD